MLLSDDTVFIYYTGLYTNIEIYCKIYTKSKLIVIIGVQNMPKAGYQMTSCCMK